MHPPPANQKVAKLSFSFDEKIINAFLIVFKPRFVIFNSKSAKFFPLESVLIKFSRLAFPLLSLILYDKSGKLLILNISISLSSCLFI